MKKTFFYCIFVFATSLLSAQSEYLMGFQAGVVQSHYASTGALTTNSQVNPYYGPNIGATFRKRIKEKYYWQAGLNYAQFGIRGNRKPLTWPGEISQGPNGDFIYTPDPSLPHQLRQVQKSDYLSIRLGIGTYLARTEKFRIGLMPFAEANLFMANKHEEKQYYDDGSIKSFRIEVQQPNEFRRVNTSIGVALSFEANISKQLYLCLSPDAAYQLLSVSAHSSNHPNRYFAVGMNAGVLYLL